MRIADGVEMLEISAPVMGRADTINPTLIWDKNDAILVDTGYPGQLPLIREAMAKAGCPFDRLTRVILTHHDLDHVGGLPAIRNEATRSIEVMAHKQESPFIQGEQRSPRFTPETIARAVAMLPPGVSEERRNAFKATLENPPQAGVDRVLAGGEQLPYCGGIVVIATPGHTPGHICLYHSPSKTLISGDAMVVDQGRLMRAVPQLALDLDMANESLKRLIEYDVQNVLCYHGGLYNDDANGRIAEIAG